MPHPARFWSLIAADPRHGQILTLGSLLAYGLGWLGFDIGLPQVAVALVSALAVQRLGDAWTGAPWRSGAKSALISALSLCLLLRTDALWIAALASTIAVGSKFVIRVRGKHVFNPTNGALVALLLTTDLAWVSPGQWGTAAAFAFTMACAGMLVVNRAARSDVTLAFIAAWATLLVGRSLSLGEPMTIPLHRLESGAFLLFSFFMISDPKTTPDSRLGRLAFAVLVATGAWYVQFRLFRTNGFLWALAAASLLVPVIDWFAPAARYQWPLTRFTRLDWRTPMSAARSETPGGIRPTMHPRSPRCFSFKYWPHILSRRALRSGRLVGLGARRAVHHGLLRKTAVFLLALGLALGASARADAFCGFYVAKADTSLFNKASQVVLVRDGDRTVITMANDFRGNPREFAMVIPVPTSITRDQIHVAEAALVKHLDAYTAPRLVEYHDPDPCAVYERRLMESMTARAPAAAGAARQDMRANSLGVTIEAQYTVGEYDILILSAAQSSGLETWLKENGYRIPAGASEVLASYIGQKMRFFVAKVNLAEQARLGVVTLRPIQVAYESPKFMLPIRLGMVNADGAQELFVYTLTRKGRVESTNYRTVKLTTDVEIPTYVKDPAVFGRMYRALFDQHVKREDMRAVFQEYAWDMGWCDPCAADPLSADELRTLGVFWLDGTASGPRPMPGMRIAPQPQNVFVTRLHVRYDKAHFPEDLVFHETGDRSNFQGRYVMRHPWTGTATCAAAETYRRELVARREREAQTLASLTGWTLADIRREQGTLPGVDPAATGPELPWWRRIRPQPGW